jgi:hypothetical protein
MANGFINKVFNAGSSIVTPTVNGGNLTMTGNTLSSTNTDGNIIINPNGVGTVAIQTSAADALTVSNSGIVTSTLNPIFRAVNTSAANDVTGDGTDYIIILQSVFPNINTMYNTADGKVTVSIAGEYIFDVTITLAGIISTHTTLRCYLKGSTGNDIEIFKCNPYNCATASGYLTFSASISNYITSVPSEYTLQIAVSNGTKVVDIYATGGSYQTTFLGYRFLN